MENQEVTIVDENNKEVTTAGQAVKFMEYLIRNNAKIRRDRAEVIAEDAQVNFRRTIEDLELKIKKLKRERENTLDLAPDHALSLKLAENFDAGEFVQKNISLGVAIRNEEIKLEIARDRYQELFGDL